MAEFLFNFVLKSAFIGGSLGAGYGLVMGIADQADLVGTLDPQPEAFWIDKTATSLFLLLHKYRRVSDVAEDMYVMMLKELDNLLKVECMLLDGLPPQEEDVAKAAKFAANAKHFSSLFLDEQSPHDCVIAKGHTDNLAVLIDTHVRHVQLKVMGANLTPNETATESQAFDMLERDRKKQARRAREATLNV